MADIRFYHPIEVRYGDLDPQGHVNNAVYLTYFEQARVAYIQHLGLWNGKSFLDIGIILAEAHVRFLDSIRLGQPVRVGVKVSRLGKKSFDMLYRLEDSNTYKELALGSSILVSYDYIQRATVPIPEVWRHAIATFDGLQPFQEKASE